MNAPTAITSRDNPLLKRLRVLAQDNAAYRKRMEGIRLSIYQCEWCGGWHLTSRPRR